ncbi:MAG: hypothetical protein HQL96_13885 [Magnetococcales bacterium]|nr:hypothetical protein [Magnetococcales bacterium]
MSTANLFGVVPQINPATVDGFGQTGSAAVQTEFLQLLLSRMAWPLTSSDSSPSAASQLDWLGESAVPWVGNDLLSQLLGMQGSRNAMNQGVAYIGKRVLVHGNHMTMTGGAGAVHFDMPVAGTANITLFNASGQVVKTASLAAGAGEQRVAIQDGGLADGSYTFAVTLKDSNGVTIAVPTLESGEVEGVVNDTSRLLLEVNGRLIDPLDVRKVELG